MVILIFDQDLLSEVMKDSAKVRGWAENGQSPCIIYRQIIALNMTIFIFLFSIHCTLED
jgi:hypothetical protein